MSRPDRNSWCTPREVWGLALDCVGAVQFDLDPCSNASSTVPATDSICLPDNGLESEIEEGEIAWMNPPYGRGHPPKWFAWATEQARRGGHVIGVVRFDTSTEAWCKSGPALVWAPPERWEFVPPEGVEASRANMLTVLALWTEDQCMRAMFARGVQGLGGYMMAREERCEWAKADGRS